MRFKPTPLLPVPSGRRNVVIPGSQTLLRFAVVPPPILPPPSGGRKKVGGGMKWWASFFVVFLAAIQPSQAVNSSSIAVTVTIDRISVNGLTLTFSDDGRIEALEHPTLGRWSREDNAAVVNAYEKVMGDDYEITSGEIWAVVDGFRISLGGQTGGSGYDPQYDLDDSGMIVSRDVGLLRLLIMLTAGHEERPQMLAALSELRLVTGLIVNSVPPYVKRAFLDLRGTKASGTMVFINRERAEEWVSESRPLLGSSLPVVTPDATKWAYFIELPDLKADGDIQILSITARDQVGNESLPVNIQVTLDQTKPTFSLTTPLTEGAAISKDGIHLEGTAGDEHFKEVLMSLYYPTIGYTLYKQPASHSPVTKRWQYDIPKDVLIEGKAFGLSIDAYDQAGNKTGIYVPLKAEGAPDTIPPHITVTSHAQGTTVSRDGFLLRGSVMDNEAVSRVHVKFFDPASSTYLFHPTRRRLGRSHLADYDPISGTWSFPVHHEQLTANHRIIAYFSAVDTRGNASPWQSVELSIG